MHCAVCKANFAIQDGTLRIYDLYVDDKSAEIGRDPNKVWDKDGFERTYQRTGYHETGAGFDEREGYPEPYSNFLFQRVKGRLLEWVEPGPQHTVLDIGCGAGYFLMMIRERYAKCGFAPKLVGIDISDAQLSYTVQRMTKEGVDAVVVHGNGEYLPFADEAFDLITCSEVIEHVRNPHRALRDMRRILKPEGLLLLSTPSMTAQNLWGKILSPFAFIAKNLTGYKSKPKSLLEGYEVPWYAHEFREAIRGANFDILDFEYNASIPHPWYSRFLPKYCVRPVVWGFSIADRFFKPVLKPLALHFVVRARKAHREQAAIN